MRPIRVLGTLVLCAAVGASSLAQTTEERLKRLEQEISELRKKKELSEAEKEYIKSLLPQSSTPGATGALSVQDTEYLEGAMLAYGTTAAAAREIATRLSDLQPPPKAVFLLNETDVRELGALQAFEAQVQVVGNHYEILRKMPPPKATVSGAPDTAQKFTFALPGAAAAVEAVPGAIKSVLDIVNLFRTDVDIKARSITLEERAFFAQVYEQVSARNIAIYDGGLLALGTVDASAVRDRLLEDISRVQKQKACAMVHLGELEEAAAAVSKKQVQEKTVPSEFAWRIAQWQKFIADADAFLATFAKPEGAATFAALLRAAALRAHLQPKETHARFLYLKIDKAGTVQTTRKNNFTGSKFFHNGGTILTYAVLGTDGRIEVANTLCRMSGNVDQRMLASGFFLPTTWEICGDSQRAARLVDDVVLELVTQQPRRKARRVRSYVMACFAEEDPGEWARLSDDQRKARLKTCANGKD